MKGSAVFVTQANGYCQDITSTTDAWNHGTHVAGLAAGKSSGIAPDATIYNAKVIHTTSVMGAGGGGGEETTLGILEAIEYLINNSVDVINISLGQYHNLGAGMRQDLVNYASLKHNIVFCISVGNSGSEYGDRGSLNNPSPALQSIAVAASDIKGELLASFSSKGPKPDYSIKPDISAPGINILGPSNSGNGYSTKSGTSMASPITAGAAALLIDYLKDLDISYTPGTIKSALLSSTKDMGFQPWRQGAGFINVSRALDVIKSSIITDNPPDIVHLHPRKLPFDPYEVLYPEIDLEFNLTAISSRVGEYEIEIPEDISDLVSCSENSIIINNSQLISINFNIPSNYSPQFINSSVMVGDQKLLIQFEIRSPVAHLLFDESFNRIARHGFGTTVYEIQGDASNTIGMYSDFVKYLSYENNYSITPHVRGGLTLEYLNNFDLLVLANPYSLSSDIYMDWIDDPGASFISIPSDSTQAIYDFVDNGGGLLVFSTDGSYCDIPALSSFMSHFDIQIQNLSSNWVVQSSVDNSFNWTLGITNIPFRGNYLQSTGHQSSVIATYNGEPTIVSYTNFNAGRVLFFGSDLTFDNIGFSTYAYG
ncbi:MAG: S8 family peptidase, partial [Candidatus Kariarchaeaceae archaeon]